MKELARLEDDGLFIDEVGTWSEEKYQLVSAYASIFAASMRKKYKALVYIDMYAGPGRVKIKHTTRIYASSPINALNVDPPFDRLVFCELEDQKLEALKARCAAGYPNRDIHFVGGDVNDNANRILSLIPQHKRDHGVLTLCFVDPYQMKNLRFDTLRGLESRWIDFLVLIPSEMDGERAYRNYIVESNTVVAEFLGNPNWRESWRESEKNGVRFAHFLVEEFGRSMEGIGRIKQELPDTWGMKNTVNRDLYRLALYSRKPLGGKFWSEAQKIVNPYRELF